MKMVNGKGEAIYYNPVEKGGKIGRASCRERVL